MKKSMFIFICALCVMTFSLFGQDPWQSFKNKTIFKMISMSGWCSKEKAHLMMELIKENQFQKCIEIGVFSGMSLFPIAKALQYNDAGKVYAIDAWDPLEAIKGFDISDSNYSWWQQLDFDHLYKQTQSLISQNSLDKYCYIIKKSSANAVNLFADGTIDFIHFDGNHNEEFSLQDVMMYFPKVKDKGYILLNDPNWFSMRRALVYLLERSEIVSSFSRASTYLLLRKNAQQTAIANTLMD